MKQLVAMLATIVFGVTGVAAEDDPAQTLHDTYCIMCHDSQVYTREGRTAHDYDSLRAEVQRWQGNVSLNWSDEQIDMVSAWLARRHYKMHCPHGC